MLHIHNPSIVYKTSRSRLATGLFLACAGAGLILWDVVQFQSGAQISLSLGIIGVFFVYFGWGQISVSKDYHCANCNKIVQFSELYFPLASEHRLKKFLESHHKNFAEDLYGAEDVMIIDQNQEDYLDVHFCHCPKCRKVGQLLSFWRVKNKKKEVILEDVPLN